MALTKRAQRLVDYNKVIVSNKPQFAAGQTLTRSQFVSLFNISLQHPKARTFKQKTANNLGLVTVQTEINILMRESGLYLASRNYYDEWVIASFENTKKGVVRYSAEVDYTTGCTTRLENTLTTRRNKKRWGKYTRVTKTQIAKITAPNYTKRHSAVVQRMDALI